MNNWMQDAWLLRGYTRGSPGLERHGKCKYSVVLIDKNIQSKEFSRY